MFGRASRGTFHVWSCELRNISCFTCFWLRVEVMLKDRISVCVHHGHFMFHMFLVASWYHFESTNFGVCSPWTFLKRVAVYKFQCSRPIILTIIVRICMHFHFVCLRCECASHDFDVRVTILMCESRFWCGSHCSDGSTFSEACVVQMIALLTVLIIFLHIWNFVEFRICICGICTSFWIWDLVWAFDCRHCCDF